jgi:hypothetical protein
MGNKPHIPGLVDFGKQMPRKAQSICTGKVDIYTYVDKVVEAIDRLKAPKLSSACAMDKALGRDNTMYNLSELSNMRPYKENKF